MIDNYNVKAMDSVNKEDWDKFVYDHPQGNIFQTSEMAEVYKRTKNYEPISLAVVDSSNDEILAVLQAVVIKEMNRFLGPLTARSIITGGPLFMEGENGQEAGMMLMEYYDKIVRKKALYTQIRNMWDTSAISGFLNNVGYTYEEHLNFLNNINMNKDELWKKLSKTRRNNITKGHHLGVSVEEVNNSNAISVVYRLLQETYTNAKLPLADISLFESIYAILKPKSMAKFFLATHEERYIGAIVPLLFKKIIFIWYLGSSRDYLRLYPNDILIWHVLEWGSENDYCTVDMGGAGKPDEEYGVREFKKRFGGQLVNFGRYTKIHSPIKMKIAEKGFEVYRKVFL